MVFKVTPFPEFSWSQSRDAIMQECQRKYYYHYYASHNGWLDDAIGRQRQAYLLKQIGNLHLVLGTVVHEMAHDVTVKTLNRQSCAAPEEWIQLVKNRLNQAYKDSKLKEQWKRKPKKFTMLHEMYYGETLPESLVTLIREKIEPCVRNLFLSETYRELHSRDDIEIVEAEQMKTTPFENERMYVIPDLLYKRGDGSYVIVDWKTGKEYEQNEDQTLLYAMYAIEHYNVPIEKVEIRLEYLLSGTHKNIVPNPSKMEQTRQWVRDSIESMKSLLENEQQNKPLDEAFFVTTPDRFKCKGCNFREICPDVL
jgi:hypothetical protein